MQPDSLLTHYERIGGAERLQGAEEDCLNFYLAGWAGLSYTSRNMGILCYAGAIGLSL